MFKKILNLLYALLKAGKEQELFNKKQGIDTNKRRRD